MAMSYYILHNYSLGKKHVTQLIPNAMSKQVYIDHQATPCDS
jgi:hypothetical protein